MFCESDSPVRGDAASDRALMLRAYGIRTFLRRIHARIGTFFPFGPEETVLRQQPERGERINRSTA